MTDVSLRAARIEDGAALTSLERECFSDPWSQESVLTSLASPLYYCRVAEQAGRIEAYLIASVVLGEGELLRIAVRPEGRCRGYGGPAFSCPHRSPWCGSTETARARR